ncbi:hybrid sensor histidine kinase/response regulator [Caulobacter vibrioides]|uniref:histidine kinase n=2 Tax=Caulobacter vibrioides TaxID=155892 RepID=Q9A3X6_CAUVC|nr:response regulator [Caulobacter vibrioides]YP_002518544.1 hybrid sensor histidine kinase/receiver domain protein [Caulobacter vibrioides NA1000]AAK25037.1 sensor histidine kinase/response regulator [Caulobacter vibrioides CB15]ACL96636.1 hybrid sensor histidine kinase/receiver domain protein [Caulobacter vibrioides NA1000]ATC29905.1 hybrid sensor histidine kinase/response regulator [Caulobacter vibrioides]QXZ51422.1 response regulator [Caulobacter vibrioides]
MRRVLILFVLVMTFGASGAWAKSDAPLAQRLEQLSQKIGAHEVRKPPRDNDDIERAGRSALREAGQERLYGLWRVLYALKSNQIQGRFDAWAARTREVARRDKDATLEALVDLEVLAYRHESGGFQAFQDKDWDRFLKSSGPDIRLMAGIERVRHLGQIGRWAEAARLAAELTGDLERRGHIAQPLLAELHQVHSYTLSDLGDKEGALDHMAQAAALDERDTFYVRKIERIYDIAFSAADLGELAAAERFATLHHKLTMADGDPGLVTWDRFLCARIAGLREAPERVIQCLAPAAGLLANPDRRLQVRMLGQRALALAQLGQSQAARRDLERLKTIPETLASRDRPLEALVEAYIDQYEGRSADAFRKLDAWRKADGLVSRNAYAKGVAEMSAALESELRVKRDESRRLTEQVRLSRSLARASVVIALLLGVLVAGAAAWAVHQRGASRRLRLAQERAEAASTAKSAFLAVMSHELRTPLNGMLGLAQALRSDQLTPAQREQVDLILDSGDTLLVLLNDILDLSKIEAGKLEIAPTAGDLVQTCARLVGGYQPTAREKGVTLSFQLDGEAPGWLMFDGVRVRQCLSNLVSNALKFTSQGKVEVALACYPEAGDRVRVRLRVADTGIGMNAATVAKLFRPFTQADASTTRNFGGTGLGLNITRRLVEMMRGDIQVESEEGVGSVFTIEMVMDQALAIEAAPSEAGATSESIGAAALQGRRVLVVDDHPVNRRVIRLFLEPFECELVEAENGRHALDVLQHEAVDLVLMDVNMPVMDGLEATRRLRQDPRFARLPVVALTADVMSAQIKTCLDAGCDAHVAKPIDLRNLLSVMDRCLAQSLARDAAARLGAL